MNVVDSMKPELLASTYVGVCGALMATSVGVPVPEEIILVLGGVAAYQGAMRVEWLIPAALAAVLVSDLWLYGMGRFWGPRLLRRRFFQYLFPPAKIEEARERYHNHLIGTVFVVRFLSGLRTATYFTAGTLRLPAHKFFLTDLIAALIHIPLFTLIGYIFSPHIAAIVGFIRHADRWVAVTVTVAVILLAALVGYNMGLRRKRK